MELKNYQKDVIDDLQAYLDLLNSNQSDSLSTVFARYWREHRRFPIPNPPTYHNTIPGVPNVCMKVPTAGGKTFIAVNALQPIFDAKNYGGKNNPKMVVWLVVRRRQLLHKFTAAFAPPKRRKLYQLLRKFIPV